MPLPFEPPLEPMLAKAGAEIPSGEGWHYEPKWDGFRCIVYNDPPSIGLQSRDLKPLNRYFPELIQGLGAALPLPMVLDGEIVIMTSHGLDFDALQQRIHPAESRVRKLAAETPAAFVAFDLLAADGVDLRGRPFRERSARLRELLDGVAVPAFVTPSTEDRAVALDWFARFEGAGFDGVVAKRLEGRYEPGKRSMIKVKHGRIADCVVGGFRWNRGEEGRSVGSLLIGLYDNDGTLHHVGHTSSFTAAEKRELVTTLAPLVDGNGVGNDDGFGKGRTPGAPSRWQSGKDADWVRLRPELVCEVRYDYLQGNRFRHASGFLRWRTDKPPKDCKFDQLEVVPAAELMAVFDR